MSNRNDNSGSTADKLTAGNLLAKNTIFNLFGQGSPLLVALVAIPLLIKHLGTERFGVLTLIWVITGYFSLFDLGLGRALTQLVADKLGQEKHQEIPALFWTALLMMLALGVLGVAILLPCSSWLVYEVLHIPPFLQAESYQSLYLIALFLPMIISTPSLRGLLEAHQRFDLTALMSIGTGIYTFLSPLGVIHFSQQLVPIVAVLLLGRSVAWGVYLVLSFKLIPALRHDIKIQRTLVKPLLNFGGWMTLSNIVGPIMVYFDRFIIGGMISMAAVAYYTTPYEVIAKLQLIPLAIVGVLFPAFSMSFFHDRSRTEGLFQRGVKYIFLVLFPCCLILNTFAYDGLNLWLGADFARHSTRVVQWLIAGILINSLAFVPFAFLQGIGRPDLPAKLHLCELPFYLVALWLLIKVWGIEGAALAWFLRASVDTMLLFFLANRLMPVARPSLRLMGLLLGYGLLVLSLASFLSNIVMKVCFFLSAVVIFLVWAWFFILDPEERKLLFGYRKFFQSSR
jgi:O-antigen/teichoic acid export membrane protein